MDPVPTSRVAADAEGADAPPVRRPRRIARPSISTGRGGGLLLLAAVVLGTVAIHVSWLVRFRRDYLTEWDESGYMQFALSNFDALRDHGPVAFARIVETRPTYGPLLPAVTALLYPVFERGVFGSLLVELLFFVVLVLATYGLARCVVRPRWAVLAALVVAGTPVVTDYTRLYHFAVPAAAMMTAGLWALLRSDGLRSTRWGIAAGAFFGLTLLARTMTVAYLPGMALAVAVQVLGPGDDRRLRIRNLALTGVTAAVVAGLWYVRNATSVEQYLTQSGYGERSTLYGHRHPILSWGFWSKELHMAVDSLTLPLAAALGLCLLAGLVFWLVRGERPHVRGLIASRAGRAMLALLLIVGEGYLALTSSKNEGTAFSLPWLPALVVVAVVVAAGVPNRVARTALAVALTGVSLALIASKSGWVAPLATVRAAHVPGLGSVTVTDGRSQIQLEVSGSGYAIGSPDQPLPRMHKRWLPFEHAVMGSLIRTAAAARRPLRLVLGMDDGLFSNTRLNLAATLWYHRYRPSFVSYLMTFPDGDNVESYRRQLTDKHATALITGEQRSGRSISQPKVEQAARSLSFVRLRRFGMPDGRTIWIWWRR